MKKVLFAWVEQIVQFDTKAEKEKFINGVRGIQVLETTENNGKVTVHIKRPYNNNQMK